MFEYREMNAGDYDACITLWKQTEGMGFLESDTEQSLKFYLERNPGISFVCYEDNKIIGAVLGGHDGRRGYIYHLAVDKNYRKKSIGKKLLELTLEKIKYSGIKRCLIMLRSDNKKNKVFWLRNGFFQRDDLQLFSKDL